MVLQIRHFFSYSINWEISETMWASRWNMYLNAKSDVQIHWFSIVNSLIVVLFLFGIIAMIIIRTVKRDISQVKKLLIFNFILIFP